MSSREYIQQAIDGQYLSIPIKYQRPSTLPATSINALRKNYAQYRKALGVEVHTAHKHFIYHDHNINKDVDVSFVRYQNIEYIRINEVLEESKEESCRTYMESGRVARIGYNSDYWWFYNRATLEYSETIDDWLNDHPDDPWIGEVIYEK